MLRLAGRTIPSTSISPGAILAMLFDAMIPEAFSEHRTLAGLIAAVGFFTAFTINRARA